MKVFYFTVEGNRSFDIYATLNLMTVLGKTKDRSENWQAVLQRVYIPLWL